MKKNQNEKASANQATVTLKKLRVSPRKLNLVAGMIRRLPVDEAINILTYSKRRIAIDVKKALQSAVANAENNHNCDVDRLEVTEASVGKQVVMKRFRARARGRAAKIFKPFSQLRIVVTERQEENE